MKAHVVTNPGVVVEEASLLESMVVSSVPVKPAEPTSEELLRREIRGLSEVVYRLANEVSRLAEAQAQGRPLCPICRDPRCNYAHDGRAMYAGRPW